MLINADHPRKENEMTGKHVSQSQNMKQERIIGSKLNMSN